MIDQKKVAIELAKAHILSFSKDFMCFALDEGNQLVEFGEVRSKEMLQKMYELFLAKIEEKIHYSE